MTRAGARFLVVVRAGDASLHPQWTQDVATRDWDLVVSYFGDDPHRYRGAGETRIDDKGQKLGGIHALLTREDFWRGYDYIWLPDDDIAITQKDVSALFRIAAAMNLALAQPALSWESYWSHRITLHHPRFRARMTNYVEIMAPCFERNFLAQCLPTFVETISGWGIDVVWPRMLPPRPRRCAIVDEVQMTHTRPVGDGKHYDLLQQAGVSAHQEFDGVLARHGIPADSRSLVYAAVDHDGRALDAAVAGDAALISRMLDSDRNLFAAYEAQRGTRGSEQQFRG